jgi:hypothetical protein
MLPQNPIDIIVVAIFFLMGYTTAFIIAITFVVDRLSEEQEKIFQICLAASVILLISLAISILSIVGIPEYWIF